MSFMYPTSRHTHLNLRNLFTLVRSMDLAQEKGASSWLTSLPIEEAKFSVEHALSCPKGGFPTIGHNEIRDLTANLLTEVCNYVCTEPELQPITDESLTGASSNVQDGARLDIAANGFWGGRFKRTYFDVRVFNPHAPSNRQSSLSSCYRRQESLKRRAYEQSQGSGTRLFYPTSSLSHWRYGKWSHCILQKTCFLSSYEVRPVILLNDVLGTLSPYFFPSPFSHPMHKRSPLE